MPTTHLLYLHGFRSSPQSFKARYLANIIAQRHPQVQWWCPQLPASPAQAMAQVLAGVAADWFGRRAVFAFGALGTAIFLPVIVLYHSPEHILWMLVVFGFLYGIPYGVNATYMTESFEAKFRGTAVGGAYNIGRIGAAIAPAAIGFLASAGSIGLGFLVMGVAYFICGVIPALFIKDKQFDPQTE